jgi:glycosyltransferase involved in cell wall biosynthesis
MIESICIIEENFYPSDIAIRTTKIAKFLKEKGYRVFILSKNQKNKETKASYNDIVIYRFNRSPHPLSILWTIWILLIVRRMKINLLILRNLKLSIPTIIVAKLLNIPIILDLSENFPAMVIFSEKRNYLDKIFKISFFIRILECLAVKLVDYVWVVVKENKERLIKQYKIKAEKVGVLRNVPILSRDENNSNFIEKKNKLSLIYIGLITKLRGIDLILEALHCIKVIYNINDIEFIIIGDGPHKTILESKAIELKISNCVKFMGWVPHEKLSEYITSSNVGVIPHKVCEFTNTTLPNKLFDYMLYGLAVLATDMKPVKSIVETEGCGIIIPEDPQKVAQVIVYLYNNREKIIEMGHRGRRAVLEKYNWHVESKAIVDTIKWLEDKSP